MEREIKPKKYYYSEDANGGIFVSKSILNPECYSAVAILRCIPEKRKPITKKGCFPGAICSDIKGKKLKIVRVSIRKGFVRENIKEGKLP